MSYISRRAYLSAQSCSMSYSGFANFCATDLFVRRIADILVLLTLIPVIFPHSNGPTDEALALPA